MHNRFDKTLCQKQIKVGPVYGEIRVGRMSQVFGLSAGVAVDWFIYPTVVFEVAIGPFVAQIEVTR